MFQESVSEAQTKLKSHKAELTAQNREIEKLGSKKDKANSTIDEKQLEIKQLEHQVSKSQSDAKDAEKRVKKFIAC